MVAATKLDAGDDIGDHAFALAPNDTHGNQVGTLGNAVRAARCNSSHMRAVAVAIVAGPIGAEAITDATAKVGVGGTDARVHDVDVHRAAVRGVRVRRIQ